MPDASAVVNTVSESSRVTYAGVGHALVCQHARNISSTVTRSCRFPGTAQMSTRQCFRGNSVVCSTEPHGTRRMHPPRPEQTVSRFEAARWTADYFVLILEALRRERPRVSVGRSSRKHCLRTTGNDSNHQSCGAVFQDHPRRDASTAVRYLASE